MAENSASTKHVPFLQKHRVALLWIAWLLAPAAWAAHLMVSYPLVGWVCDSGRLVVLHLITVIAAVVALTGLAAACLHWRETQRATKAVQQVTLGRNRFFALTGIAMGLFFLILILAEGIPNFIVNPCLGGI